MTAACRFIARHNLVSIVTCRKYVRLWYTDTMCMCRSKSVELHRPGSDVAIIYPYCMFDIIVASMCTIFCRVANMTRFYSYFCDSNGFGATMERSIIARMRIETQYNLIIRLERTSPRQLNFVWLVNWTSEKYKRRLMKRKAKQCTHFVNWISFNFCRLEKGGYCFHWTTKQFRHKSLILLK